MNIRLLRRIIGLILTALLLTGIILMAGVTAAAQGRGQRRIVIVRPISPFRPYGPYRRFERYSFHNQYVFRDGESAYSQGFHDGRKTGESDAHKDKSYDPERSHYFHDAGFGNFAEAYRDGFNNGYREGFESRIVG